MAERLTDSRSGQQRSIYTNAERKQTQQRLSKLLNNHQWTLQRTASTSSEVPRTGKGNDAGEDTKPTVHRPLMFAPEQLFSWMQI